MSNLFVEAATNVRLESVLNWKKNGGKVVGYTCSFMPVEILHAAGILPVRLRGLNAGSMELADAYYGPFVCSFPKALLQLAGKGVYDFLDGAIISNGCDTLRRLEDCWRHLGNDVEKSLPDWFYYFDVPHKPDDHAVEWYMNQVTKLIRALEDTFDVTITDEKLSAAIQKQNRIRKRLWELETLRREDSVKVSGKEAYAAIIAGTVLPQDLYEEHLTALITDIRKRTTTVSDGKKKLFLGGSICDDFQLVSLIEESDALVVGENVCFGVRHDNDLVDESLPPAEALTQKYLSASVCPRMMGWYKERAGMIIEKIENTHAQGVIMQNIRFCDLHGSENGLLERDLDNANVPALRIEREHGPLTESGRLKMRVDAFIEQLET